MPITSKITKTPRRRRQRGHKGLVLVFATLAILLSLAGALLWVASGPAETTTAQGVGGPFQLVRRGSKIVTDRNFRGKYMLIYFGYTHCSDVCPTTLSDLTAALQRLGADGSRVQPIFITVDPTRDTPKVVTKYVASFSSRLVGLTGSAAEIASAEQAYHVDAIKVRSAHDGGEYSIDHSAVLYLMGRQGEFIAALPAGQSAKALAADIARHLS